jgi:glutamate formiminotransferase
MMKTAMSVAASIPPITVVPMIWRATDPAPLAVHSGTHPRMNANDVIRIGRRRTRAAVRAASVSGCPPS